MAVIANPTPKALGVMWPKQAETYPVIYAEDLVAGDVVCYTSTGRVQKAAAGTAGKDQPRGIVLETAKAGQDGSLLVRGHLAGFTITQAYDARLFLSNTLGAVDDAAGTKTIPIGRVVPLSDKPTFTKVVYFDFSFTAQW